MLKSILSVLAGYGVMIAATLALFFALARLRPAEFGPDAGRAPGTVMMLVILAAGLLAAAGGGWVTARLAAEPRLRHVQALAALVLVMGVVSLASPAGPPAPAWYRAGLLVVGLAGVFLGGRA